MAYLQFSFITNKEKLNAKFSYFSRLLESNIIELGDKEVRPRAVHSGVWVSSWLTNELTYSTSNCPVLPPFRFKVVHCLEYFIMTLGNPGKRQNPKTKYASNKINSYITI